MFLSVGLGLLTPSCGKAQKFCRRFCFCAGAGFDLETESCSGLESQSFTLGGSKGAMLTSGIPEFYSGRINKNSKEWRTMKVTFDFDNGTQLSLKPENIKLIDNGGKETVAITSTDSAVIPLIFFKGVLATAEELKARSVAATQAAKTEAP